MFNQTANIFLNKLIIKSSGDKTDIYRLIFNRSLQLYCPSGHILIPSQSELPPKSSLDYKLGEELLREFSSDMKNIVAECLSIYDDLKQTPLKHNDIVHVKDNNSILFKGKYVLFKPMPFLFLDIDGTLLYGCKEKIVGYDHKIFIKKKTLFIKLRPYVKEFLDRARSSFNVVLYTAANSEYADSVANLLGGNFELILSRRHCQLSVLFYLKDIRILNVDLKRAVLIDNEKRSFSVTPENGVLIKDYNCNPNDRELFKMMDLLDRLVNANDFRVVIGEVSKIGY